MKFVKESLIDNWEEEQEKSLEWEEQMKNWWKVELRDYAASDLRDYTVENNDEIRDLAINSLHKLGYSPTNLKLHIAINILSNYINFSEDFDGERPEPYDPLLESLGDILKPKSREDVIKELNKLSLEQKLEAIDSYYYDKGELLDDLTMAGTDTGKITSSFFDSASREELIDIINELLDYEPNPVELLIASISDKKYDEIFKKYTSKENKEELNNIINNLIIKHTDIIREYDDIKWLERNE